jgi:hypothetical protein
MRLSGSSALGRTADGAAAMSTVDGPIRGCKRSHAPLWRNGTGWPQ